MNHLTKGALTMVLAGSVTFSVANAWLGGQPAKHLLEKVNAIAHSELQKKGNFLNNQADQTVKDQAPKTANIDVQTTSSPNTAAVQVVTKKRNKSDPSIPSAKPPTETSTVRVTSPAKKATTSRASSYQPTVQTTSTRTNASKTVTTASKPTAGTTTSSAHSHAAPNNHASSSSTKASTQKTSSSATATTNHGQQVSEIQKEKNATKAANKANNGKKI